MEQRLANMRAYVLDKLPEVDLAALDERLEAVHAAVVAYLPYNPYDPAHVVGLTVVLSPPGPLYADFLVQQRLYDWKSLHNNEKYRKKFDLAVRTKPAVYQPQAALQQRQAAPVLPPADPLLPKANVVQQQAGPEVQHEG